MAYNSSSNEALGTTPGATSYFSKPSDSLDPKLFGDGDILVSSIREEILDILFDYLGTRYVAPHKWTQAWLAGSGVSYQWRADRQPGDLDCLIGIDYIVFRQNNQDYVGASDLEISKMFNEDFSNDLMPSTSNWHGYELTFYVNPQTDIRDINPYAAYDLINDEWTVPPAKDVSPPYSRMWEEKVRNDATMANEIVKRYGTAKTILNAASNPASRINAETDLKNARAQAAALFDEIHSGRKIAFSKVGAGYADFHNYRWQSGKRSGIIQLLKNIKESTKNDDVEKYGVELPSSDTLIRRVVTGRTQ